MITCQEIEDARELYGETPEDVLPEHLRNPSTLDDKILAATLRFHRERDTFPWLYPICQDGLFQGWAYRDPRRWGGLEQTPWQKP